MDQNQLKGCGCLLQALLMIGMWVAAFVVYPPKAALMILLVLGPLNLVAVLAGLVPLFGPYLYWQASKAWVFPMFFGWFPEIQATWVTSVIFWSGFVSSLFLTLTTTALVASAAKN